MMASLQRIHPGNICNDFVQDETKIDYITSYNSAPAAVRLTKPLILLCTTSG